MIRGALIQFIVSLVVLVLAIVGYVFWYGSITSLSARSADLQAQVAAHSDDLTRTAAAKTALETLVGEEQSIQNYFVSTDEVVPFLEEIQLTGKSLGTKIDVASVSADNGSQPHLTLSLRIEGSFDAVLRTVGAIEYSPRDMVVTDLALGQAPGAAGASVWAATGTFVVGTHAPSKKTATPQILTTPIATSTATTTP